MSFEHQKCYQAFIANYLFPGCVSASPETLTTTPTSSTTDYPVGTMAKPLLSKQQQMELLQKALLLKAQLATAIQRSAAHSAAALLMYTSTTALSRTSATGGGDGEYAFAATDVALPSSHVTFTINTSTQLGTMLHGATSSKDHFDIEMVS